MKEYKITSGDLIFTPGKLVTGQKSAVDPISREHLQQALELAADRLPFLRTEFVEHDGCLWLRENGKPFIVSESTTPPPYGDEQVNGHPVAFSCKGNTIYFWYDHVMCDGHGFAMIMMLVQYHYCRLHYGVTPAYDSPIRPDAPFTGREIADPYANLSDTQPVLPLPETAFLPPEADLAEPGSGHTNRLRIPKDAYLQTVKQLSSTPAALAAVLLCRVLNEMYPDTDAPITPTIAMDARSILGCTDTVQNTLISLFFPYTDDIRSLPVEKQPAVFCDMLNRQREPAAIRAVMAAQRQRYLMKVQSRLGSAEPPAPRENLSAFLVTYVGGVSHGEIDNYFHGLIMNNSPAMPAMLGITQEGDVFNFDILSMFKNNAVYTGLLQQLRELNIPYLTD